MAHANQEIPIQGKAVMVVVMDQLGVRLPTGKIAYPEVQPNGHIKWDGTIASRPPALYIRRAIGREFDRALYTGNKYDNDHRDNPKVVAPTVTQHANLFCPDCGRNTLRVIEQTEPAGDEYKIVCTCNSCENMVHVFRNA